MVQLVRLYRYLSLESALRTLESRKFRVGLVSEFNDPFDGIFGFDGQLGLGPTEKNEVRAFLSKQWERRFGVLCFSKVPDEPLMWAHYANLHRGIVLECGIPTSRKLRESSLLTIQYRKRLPMMTPSEFEDKSASGVTKLLRKALTTKSLHWKYEKEIRMLISLDDDEISAHNGGYFVPIIGLQRIILGARCDISLHYLRRVLKGAGFEGIPIEVASLSHSEFKVDIGPPQKWA